MKVEDIAKVVHEVNRVFCQSTGDESQLPWEDAPQWQKDSAIAGVEFILNNPNSTPMETHQAWLRKKIKDGWKYGPVKNEETKEHPCCLHYDDLPANEKAKDKLFNVVVNNLRPFLE